MEITTYHLICPCNNNEKEQSNEILYKLKFNVILCSIKHGTDMDQTGMYTSLTTFLGQILTFVKIWNGNGNYQPLFLQTERDTNQILSTTPFEINTICMYQMLAKAIYHICSHQACKIPCKNNL